MIHILLDEKKLHQEYNNLVKTEAILLDEKQIIILDHLEQLRSFLAENQKKFFKKKPDYHGIYIYGSVGCGKSLLMDLFFNHIEITKRRIHFHEFMTEIHQKLHKLQQSDPDLSDPIKYIAKNYAKKIKLLCFDEFQVTDIADAMILERLFRCLFDYEVTIVTTSNRHPKDLYKGGLQQEKYFEFVRFLESRSLILQLDSEVDYRREFINNLASHYIFPIDTNNDNKIQNIIKNLTKDQALTPCELTSFGRKFLVTKSYEKLAIIDFNEFCKNPYSASDYQIIAKKFEYIIFNNIPKLKIEDRDFAKRMVNLIDILYEAKAKVIFYANCKAEEIYPKGKGSFEFERTLSRISEMQNMEW